MTSQIPNFRVNIHGVSLDSIGLGDAWLVGPSMRAHKVTGLAWYPGQTIIESLLTDVPEDHFIVFDRLVITQPANVLVLH